MRRKVGAAESKKFMVKNGSDADDSGGERVLAPSQDLVEC